MQQATRSFRFKSTRLLFPAGALAISIAVAACGPPPPPNLSDGHQAPTFLAETVSGATIKYPADLNGKPSILLVWSTWCPYCKVVMPRLSEIKADYSDVGLQIVAVNAMERGRGDPEQFIRDAGYDFVTITIGDGIAEAWEVDYLPGLFVVDGDGTIVFRRKWTELPAGYEIADLWERQIRAALDDLLPSARGGTTTSTSSAATD